MSATAAPTPVEMPDVTNAIGNLFVLYLIFLTWFSVFVASARGLPVDDL